VSATHKISHTIAFLMVADETFDVGVDTLTAVSDGTGKIDKLTFSLGLCS